MDTAGIDRHLFPQALQRNGLVAPLPLRRHDQHMALGTRREQPGQTPVKLGETTKRLQPSARKRHQFLDGGKITSLNTEALGLRGKEIRVHAFVDHVNMFCNLLRVLLFLPARGRDHQIAFRKGIELAEVTDAALGKLHGGPGRPLREKGVIGSFCVIPFRIHGMERLRENILREKTASPSGMGVDDIRFKAALLQLQQRIGKT